MVYESNDDGSWKEKDEENKDEKEGDDKEDGEKKEEEKSPKSLDYEDFLCQYVIQSVRKTREPLTRSMFDSFPYVNKAGGGQKHYNHIKRWLYHFQEKRQDSNRLTLNELATLFYGLSIKGIPCWFTEEMRIKKIDYSLDEWKRLTFYKHGEYTIKGRHRKIYLVGETPEEEEKGLDDDVFAMNKDGTLISSESLNNTKNSSSLSIFRHKTQQSDENTFDMTFQPSIFSTPRTCHHVVYMGKDAYRMIFGAGYAKGNPMKVRCDHLKPMIEMIITLIKTSGVSKNSDTGLVVRASVIKSIINWWEKLSDHTCTLKVSEGPCKNTTISNEELSCMIVFFEDYLNLNAE